ncbi:hypothetical protein CCAE64S_02686 [Castellaniella caeni]
MRLHRRFFSCSHRLARPASRVGLGLPSSRARGLHRQRGQAMVEYVIVVALVAVAAIAVYQLFGQVIRAQTAAMAREIAGEDGSEQSRMAQSAAESAAAQAAAKTLKSFTGNAAAGQ